ncbi:MAG: serine/threonine protein kinase [Burkholderiaceae bacterium]|nr:serine/threonine protein kinase [Burkholderiaceae bacterium]
MDGASSDGSPAAGQSLTIGHIGRYALKQQLGEGGLGTVYAAYDPILSRTIAVKTLHLSVAEGDRATLDALFLNEARAAAGLNHPNIVTVYDAGLSEQGVYIAMERLRGRDLRQLLANGWRPDIVQAAQILRRVSDALSYAHSKGVIHCDIKPANIFMVGRTLPKVVDFGIARVAHGQDIPALEGVVAGSPHYLAPEQLRGETVDRRCDVYALGVVMYELLTHRKAFDGKTLAEIVHAVEHVRPPAPHEVRPEVPVALSDITMRAIAHDPGERYRSARQMSQALRDWIESEAEIAGEDGAPGRAVRRRMLLATLLVGAVIGGVIGWRLVVPEADTAQTPEVVAAAPAAPVAVEPDPTPAPPPAPAVDDAAPVNRAAVATAVVPPAPRARQPERPAARETKERSPREASARPAPAVAATGMVQLAITPWGQIEIDGKNAGVTPPLSQLKLSVGEHVITVRNEDFAPHTVTVRVSADQPVTVRHRFGS